MTDLTSLILLFLVFGIMPTGLGTAYIKTTKHHYRAYHVSCAPGDESISFAWQS